MARPPCPKMTKAAKHCVAVKIREQYHSTARARRRPQAQKVAIAFAKCRREGFRIPDRSCARTR